MLAATVDELAELVSVEFAPALALAVAKARALAAHLQPVELTLDAEACRRTITASATFRGAVSKRGKQPAARLLLNPCGPYSKRFSFAPAVASDM